MTEILSNQPSQNICNVNSGKMIDMCKKITSKRKYFGRSLCTSFHCLCASSEFFSSKNSKWKEKKSKAKRDAVALIALSDGCLNVYSGLFSQRTWNFSFNTPSASYILISHRWCRKFVRNIWEFCYSFKKGPKEKNRSISSSYERKKSKLCKHRIFMLIRLNLVLSKWCVNYRKQ